MRNDTFDFIHGTLVFLIAVLTVITLALLFPDPQPVTAVCSTDLDCARWEELNNIPDADRCYGAPCPAKDR